ncbi:MAG UNVERIFIED_CONTAM: hypothetical protein LVR18_44210 [Planctomycetaceae bacterium]
MNSACGSKAAGAAVLRILLIQGRLRSEWKRGRKLRQLLLRELAWRHSKPLPINTDEYSRRFPDADQHEFLKMALSEHQSRVQDDSPGPGSVGGVLCDRYLLLRRLAQEDLVRSGWLMTGNQSSRWPSKCHKLEKHRSKN